MKVPFNWVNDYLSDRLYDPQEFADRLTMLGQKAESVTQAAPKIKNVVAGRVLEIKKHGQYESLYIVLADVGKSEPVTIVTGAKNVTEGAFVPIALCGAAVHSENGEIKKIEEGEFKGVSSRGMLCSVFELGFTANEFPEAPENGIYIISAEDMDGFSAGDDIRDVLMLRDSVIDFEITSNRPDCLSLQGIAREAAAAYDLTVVYPEGAALDNSGAAPLKIDIEASSLCERYCAAVVKDVTVKASPLWLRRRLADAGVRPVNNVVDITNFVMLETGQPLHAFDLRNIEGGAGGRISIRLAGENECLTTLDGSERRLGADLTVIADDRRALAVAGVMGGLGSAIAEDGSTTEVLLEAACFNAESVRLASKKLGLRTEASLRFEKGVDPNLALTALRRAAYLFEELGVGTVVRAVADCYPAGEELSLRRSIQFDAEEVNNHLGVELSFEEMRSLVLPFEIELDKPRSLAIIPTFRADIQCIADLAEEIARAYGYSHIPSALPKGTTTIGKKTRSALLKDTIRDAMTALGFSEAMTFSFEPPDMADKLLIAENSALRNVVRLQNPLGEGVSVMRTTAVGGMLQSLKNNALKRAEGARLFELANVYFNDKGGENGLPSQRSVVCAGMYGEGLDFYTAKGFLEELLEGVLGIEGVVFSAEGALASWLHSGRAAEIFSGGSGFVAPDTHDTHDTPDTPDTHDTPDTPDTPDTLCRLGCFGELHPDCAESFGLEKLGANKRVYIWELDLEALQKSRVTVRKYREIPKFPSVNRDFAFVAEDSVTAGAMLAEIYDNGGDFLESASVFDVYKDDALGKDKKSVAFALVFRSKERTLSDSEVNPAADRIVASLKRKFGAELRA